jgi:hypothetical protein
MSPYTYLLDTFLNHITIPETRASNKWAYPGKSITPKPCQSKDEVEAEHVAKAQAKMDCEETKTWSIIRAAEFEHVDRADEYIVNPTPHPPFTPNSCPPLYNKNKANLTLVAEISDVETPNDVENI